MIVELYVPPKKGAPDPVLEQIASLEKRIFPKHESMSSYLKEEISRKNTSLLFVRATCSAEGDIAPVVGYLVYTVNSLVGNITKLAVHEAFRRQGYALALINAAIESLKSRRVGSVALHVDPSRTAAAELYKKLGFLVESEHESYYAPGRAAVRMVLELSSR